MNKPAPVSGTAPSAATANGTPATAPIAQPAPAAPAPAADLDPQQLAAVLAPRGPVCVLAGAGTGKTRTITRRIAHLVERGHVAPGQVLAVTFTARAAGEMRSRLRQLGISRPGQSQVQAVTFHSAARRQLAYFWPRVIGDTRWQLIDSKYQLVARAAQRAGIAFDGDTVRDLISEVEWAKGSLVGPEEYGERATALGRGIPVSADAVATVMRNYEDLKRTEGGIGLDFDDLLLYTAGALENDAAVAEEFRDRYRCFVVDEYQDVTPLQQRLLDAWVGGRDDLTVVGDANQTIYSFTGATPKYLLGFTRKYPEAALIRLERDYRSTPEVVALANTVIGQASGRIAGSRLQLIGQRPSGPAPTFTSYDDERAEAEGVVRGIQQLAAQGVPYREMAVLYRINAQSEGLEEALTDVAIPYQVRGGEQFFQRNEVRQAMGDIATLSARPDLPEELLGDKVIAAVRAVLRPRGLTDVEPEGMTAKERYHGLTGVVRIVEELAREDPGLTLGAVVAELRQRADHRQPPQVEGVTLASLHAAKGLEWDAVFIVGLNEGMLPIQHVLKRGEDPEGIEEERRLLYVGVTRARAHLACSWSLARTPGGKKNRKRSRFLDGVVQPEPGEVAVNRRKASGAARHLEADPQLFEKLRAWRKAEAAEADVPTYVIFPDSTLAELAHHKPGAVRELVRISGIGPVKLERYGEALLRVIAEHRAETDGSV